MGKTLDLGRRIELHSMDKHCHDISLGLYRRHLDGAARFLIHTYSSASGATERVRFIGRAMCEMLGLEATKDDAAWFGFPCGTDHDRALKRAFLDLCKLETGASLDPNPLAVFDKKADCELYAESRGDGVYRINAPAGNEKAAKRAVAVARGFAKVCEMDIAEGTPTDVSFPCGTPHDELIGMLMFRAQNVRAAMHEDEMAASRGVLSAPSQQ